MFNWNKIVLATRNQGKVKELRQMFEPFGIEVESMAAYPDAPEVVEDGKTFTENALKKAQTISDFLGIPALADDSGLEVDALDGRPGVYSARFAGPDADDQENNVKLMEAMRDVPPGERAARFRCVLALVIPNEQNIMTEGTCEGQIALEASGTGGFGYDPLFYLPEWEKTMAALSREEKNQISHRGQAIKKLKEEWSHKYGGTVKQ